MSTTETRTVVGIELPGGGRLVASSAPKALPPACSAAASLEMQLAPFLAAQGCQLRVLRLLAPLIAIIETLPNPPAKARQEFASAAAELEPYLAAVTPAVALPFARDLLCLQIRNLNCLLRTLRAASVLAPAQPGVISTGDVQSIVDSYQPIVALFMLASPFFQMAGLQVPAAPPLVAGTDPAALGADERIIAAFLDGLQPLLDAVGGCE